MQHKCSSNVRQKFMTTFLFTLKNTTKKNGEKSIVILFIKDRKNTTLSIQKSCMEEQWSYETERVKKNHPDYKKLNAFIEKYKIIIQKIIDDLEDENIPYTLPDLINRIKSYKGKGKTKTFTEFITENTEILKSTDKIGSAKIEKQTLQSLQTFFGKKDIGFNELTFQTLKKYENYCVIKGNKPATIGMRLRTIRYIFNMAIKSKIIKESQYPFKEYKISGVKSTSKKEYLSQDEITALLNYESEDHYEKFAKNIFLFSYYSRGINFIDLLKLEKTAIYNDSINYIRTKTGVPVSFKLTDTSKQIIEDYKSDADSKFIFNILKDNNNEVGYVKNKTAKYLQVYVNPYLKNIMKNLGIKKNITYYCARHSFATALKFNNISIDIIREALGHKDINSTMSYLNSLPDAKLDKIIEDVLV